MHRSHGTPLQRRYYATKEDEDHTRKAIILACYHCGTGKNAACWSGLPYIKAMAGSLNAFNSPDDQGE